jgi:hypothetical protein
MIFHISSLAACATVRSSTTTEKWSTQTLAETVQATEMPKTAAEDISFAAQYIRTGGWDDSIEYPQTVAIRSLEDLFDYYDANKNTYNLSGFADAISVYDATFFDENALALTVLLEPSGSIRHRVTDVCVQDDTLYLHIDRLLPEAQTCDMALWHIITEVPQQSLEGRQIDLQISDVQCDAL